MKKLTLKNCRQENALLLDYDFIDHYMPEANGEYVKVYLLLLRHQSSPEQELTISGIADLLDDTENDVLRALKYWKKQGLLDYEITQDSESGPNHKPDRQDTPDRSRNRQELKELLFVTEQYLGKPLSASDMKTITYFHDELDMSADLIEYLIEYCVENGHKSMHYIQKVALSWTEQCIRTPEEARKNAAFYSKSCYGVLKAFGITGRSPASSELSYIRRWSEEYGFSDELILEACGRTMNSIHQPSFDYTESILKSWMEQGVKNKKDIEVLDLAYQKGKKERKETSRAGQLSPAPESPKKSRNRFNNFEGRTYENMEDLTRRLIQNQ